MGLMDPKIRSVPSYWTLWGTYMEGCDYTNSCGMDSTHSTWCKQISHAWRRFAAVLPLGFLHSVGCSHAQIVLASSVCISLQGEAIFVHRRTTFAPTSLTGPKCRLDHCGWHCTRSSNSMPDVIFVHRHTPSLQYHFSWPRHFIFVSKLCIIVPPSL